MPSALSANPSANGPVSSASGARPRRNCNYWINCTFHLHRIIVRHDGWLDSNTIMMILMVTWLILRI